MMIEYVLTFVSRSTGELGDTSILNLKSNLTNALTNRESKEEMLKAFEEIIFLFRYEIF